MIILKIDDFIVKTIFKKIRDNEKIYRSHIKFNTNIYHA